MRRFVDHRKEAIVCEKALVVNRELRGRVNRNDRRATVQCNRVIVVLHFAFVRVANRNRARRFEARKQLSCIELHLRLCAFMVVPCRDRRDVGWHFRRPTPTR